MLKKCSLYIHIPFCSLKCGYCDFYSIPSPSQEIREKIIQQIIYQIHNFIRVYKNPEITTVYIGGGTPTFLTNSELYMLLSGISGAVNLPSEYTVEANPENLTPEKCLILEETGVSRLSIGIQTLNPGYLELLGRNAGIENIAFVLEKIIPKWKGDINLDLMTLLPGQKLEEALNDCRNLISFSPDHISLYALTLEKGTPLYTRFQKGDFTEHTQEEASEILHALYNMLKNNGYDRYEISNFCRPGKKSRHNTSYWKMEPYIGCGPSAVSTLPSPEGPVRLENPRNLAQFLEGRKIKWNIQQTPLASKEFLFEHFMMGLRTVKGVDLKHMKRCFPDISPADIFKNLFQQWEQRQLCNFSQASLSLTPQGMDIMNSLLLDLLAVIDGLQDFSVSWPDIHSS